MLNYFMFIFVLQNFKMFFFSQGVIFYQNLSYMLILECIVHKFGHKIKDLKTTW